MFINTAGILKTSQKTKTKIKTQMPKTEIGNSLPRTRNKDMAVTVELRKPIAYVGDNG